VFVRVGKPWRTMYALVKETNSMTTGASATNSPNERDASVAHNRAEPLLPRPSSPPPVIGGCTPPPPWPVLGCLIVIVESRSPYPALVRRDRHGISLHDVIPRRSERCPYGP
jgi:hypothetical protein